MDKKLKSKTIAIFEGNQIRRRWDSEKELWYFAVSDVIAVLTKSIDPVAYWRKLKERLLKEGGNETVTKCHGLKMIAPDGKMRLIDAADTEVMLRLIQSIPSPNAEPFKLWLAREGGSVAGNARKDIESKTGKSAITNKNAKMLRGGKIKKFAKKG